MGRLSRHLIQFLRWFIWFLTSQNVGSYPCSQKALNPLLELKAIQMLIANVKLAVDAKASVSLLQLQLQFCIGGHKFVNR